MLHAMSRWLRSKKSPHKAGTRRSPQGRPGLEALETRELLSGGLSPVGYVNGSGSQVVQITPYGQTDTVSLQNGVLSVTYNTNVETGTQEIASGVRSFAVDQPLNAPNGTPTIFAQTTSGVFEYGALHLAGFGGFLGLDSGVNSFAAGEAGEEVYALTNTGRLDRFSSRQRRYQHPCQSVLDCLECHHTGERRRAPRSTR